MTRKNKGHYSEKHINKTIDSTIKKQIDKNTSNHQITCAAIHKIADSMDISPENIGIQTDLMECRIMACQLGLFGYADKKKKIDPDIIISSDLHQTIDAATNGNKISCIKCWEIAKDLSISRLVIGSACEKKGLKIKPCQLGAF